MILPLIFALLPLLTLTKSFNKLSIDTNDFLSLIKKPRHYSLVVEFTALDSSVGCEPCRKLHPEFKLLQQSYSSFTSDKKVIFVSLDFQSGREIFAKYGLQSAPVVLCFNPDTNDYAKWDIKELTADALLDWVNRIVPDEIKSHLEKFSVSRPFDYYKFAVNASVLLSVAAVIRIFYEKVLGFLRRKVVWTVGCLVFIVLMDAGYMWNQIRGAAYSGKELIQAQFQSQFQIETQIVALLYSVLAALTVLLVVKVPELKGNVQRVVGLGVLCAWVLGYSVLFRVFKIKNGGYPFGLL